MLSILYDSAVNPMCPEIFLSDHMPMGVGAHSDRNSNRKMLLRWNLAPSHCVILKKKQLVENNFKIAALGMVT